MNPCSGSVRVCVYRFESVRILHIFLHASSSSVPFLIWFIQFEFASIPISIFKTKWLRLHATVITTDVPWKCSSCWSRSTLRRLWSDGTSRWACVPHDATETGRTRWIARNAVGSRRHISQRFESLRPINHVNKYYKSKPLTNPICQKWIIYLVRPVHLFLKNRSQGTRYIAVGLQYFKKCRVHLWSRKTTAVKEYNLRTIVANSNNDIFIQPSLTPVFISYETINN